MVSYQYCNITSFCTLDPSREADPGPAVAWATLEIPFRMMSKQFFTCLVEFVNSDEALEARTHKHNKGFILKLAGLLESNKLIGAVAKTWLLH